MTREQGTSRSEAAKGRILVAARSVFSESGYDRATVRQIADRANVVPAMLVRYFGGKAGVFAAVHFEVALPLLEGMEPRTAGERLAAYFFEQWDTNEGGGDLVALLRASADHPAARDRLLSFVESNLGSAVVQFSGPKGASKAATLIASQILGLVFCRYVLDLPSLRALPRDDLIREVGQNLGDLLEGFSTLKKS